LHAASPTVLYFGLDGRTLKNPAITTPWLFPLLVLIFSFCLTGCRRSDSGLLPFGNAQQIGTSVHGKPIHSYSFGSGSEVVLLMATIHGDEWAGTPLLNHVGRLLHRRPDLTSTRKVILVPVANPDGFEKQTRTNSRGVDLNRNFPAVNRRDTERYGKNALSEPESRALYDLLQREKPTRIVSIHQPLKVVDWDGPGESLARAMGEHCELKVERLGSRPGSLGSYAGEDLQIPIITYELPREASRLPNKVLWEKFGNPLLAAVTFPAPLPPAFEIPAWPGQTAMAASLAASLVIGIIIARKRSRKKHEDAAEHASADSP
jgi:murein peptide amidase A